jgi:hypothetical protein
MTSTCVLALGLFSCFVGEATERNQLETKPAS